MTIMSQVFAWIGIYQMVILFFVILSSLGEKPVPRFKKGFFIGVLFISAAVTLILFGTLKVLERVL